MKLRLLLASLAASLTVALGQGDDATFLAQYEKTFERRESVRSADFVPAESMEGKLHMVLPLADNDGLLNTYTVDTADGVVEVTGTPALLLRIRELYALDYLRNVSRTDEFTKALSKAGKAKLESAATAVRDPIKTIKNVPKGASRFFGRIGEGMKGHHEEGAGGALEKIAGVDKAKAQLAAKLGVSPYTTNEELQRQLTEVARVSAGGGLVLNAATAAVGGTVVSALGLNQTLQDTLVNSTPEDLRIINRKQLLALGVDRSLADEFLMHPWFSPWHETIITDSFTKIGVNPSAFLSDAVRALTPEDALFFQRVAQILARYHAKAAPLRAVRFDEGVITALDRNGTLVIPVSLDYGIWAERAARRAEEMSAFAKGHEEIKGLALWVDGRLSERLCTELKNRGIAYQTDSLSGK